VCQESGAIYLDECTPIFSIAVPTHLLADLNVSATAKLLYGVIESFQRKSGVCFATNERLAAEIAGCSERTISRCVAELRDAGYIGIDNEKGQSKKAPCRKIYLTPSASDGQGVDKIVYPPRQNCLGGVDKNGDIVIHKSNTEKNKKIDPLPVFVEWIRCTFPTRSAEEMNGLYLDLKAYAEMRSESKSHLDTSRKVSGLLNDLIDESSGDLELMRKMLRKATNNCWLSVHAPKGQAPAPPPQQPGGRDKEWL
jgi:hypothetical protein